ncbi:hypothetical protein ABT124_36145 [Streptomyces sp. NPDC001982]|uniref:hypothetical protein n=1 Tax=unclassified Streptomyces TaxID=2593676 RepID=UPI0033237613
MEEIRDNLVARIAEAEREGWLGEVEGLRVSLTVATPAGTVRATAGPRQADAIIFELAGAMRASVHVTGTHHPRRWHQFTAVRACLGPVSAFQATAPVDDLPRLARSRTGYRGSLTLYADDDTHHPEVTVYPMESAAGHDPSGRCSPSRSMISPTRPVAGL